MRTRILITLLLTIFTISAFATNGPGDIVLEKPNLKKGATLMEALSKRQSIREYSTKELSKADLSDLLWAANGINRENGKRTAPSARNQQEIAIYVFTKVGIYEYDFKNHTLVLEVKGDHRELVAGSRAGMADAPMSLVYVADISKLSSFGERAMILASIDTGIVVQNVNLFCASTGLGTVPRQSMKTAEIKTLLNLSDTELPLMNNVIGYIK